MLKQIQRELVRRVPGLLRWPARLVPFAVQQQVMGRLLSRVFREALADGDFAFLQDRWLRIEVRDLRLAWFITYANEQLQMTASVPQADATFSAELNDLILIAARKEDPDSLFFQRRLRIEGDTELGLEVKNLMDSLDLAQLPSIMRYALQDLALFVQQGLAPDSVAKQPAGDAPASRH